jgi:hypothetical protein
MYSLFSKYIWSGAQHFSVLMLHAILSYVCIFWVASGCLTHMLTSGKQPVP